MQREGDSSSTASQELRTEQAVQHKEQSELQFDDTNVRRALGLAQR